MRINDATKVEELGYLLRTNGCSLGIEYGSGGYAVSIKDLKSGTTYLEISNDLLDAVKRAFDSAMANKTYFRDEKTDPGTPIGKNSVSIKELSKLLLSGSDKKIKY